MKWTRPNTDECKPPPSTPTVLIAGNDTKARCWQKHAACQGRALIPIRGGLALIIDLVRYMLLYGRPEALIVRYLNDRPNMIKSLCYTLGLSGSLLLCKFTKVRIIWFCHNVDCETRTLYPRLTNFRRNLASSFSTRIFLMDPLINEYHSTLFHSTLREKLDWTTFGRPLPIHQCSHHDIEHRIRDFALSFRRQADSQNRIPLIGVCLGDAGPKYAHFDFALPLIEHATKTRFAVGLIIGGNIWETATPKQKNAVLSLAEREDVLLFPHRVEVDESRVRDSIDFIWRGYRDVSMSYSLYVAAAAELPVLTLNMGFVSLAVSQYGLGVVVEPDFRNLNASLEELITWDPSSARRFLQTHSWNYGIRRVFSSIEATSRHRR